MSRFAAAATLALQLCLAQVALLFSVGCFCLFSPASFSGSSSSTYMSIGFSPSAATVCYALATFGCGSSLSFVEPSSGFSSSLMVMVVARSTAPFIRRSRSYFSNCSCVPSWSSSSLSTKPRTAPKCDSAKEKKLSDNSSGMVTMLYSSIL